MNARELVVDLLERWSGSRRFADELLGDALDHARLSPPDAALATELFYGCLRHKLALEYLLGRFAPKPPRAQLSVIIQLGLYQLFFLERIPVHAAVHATVELAKRGSSIAETRFVNAVLRQTVRTRVATRAAFDRLRETEPWTWHSHPRWLFDRWQSSWGTAPAVALCEWDNTPPPVYFRVNTLRAVSREQPPLTAGSAGCRGGTPLPLGRERPPLPAGIAAEPAPFHPLCWRARDPSQLFQTAAWTNGEIYVQDPSTLLAVDVLDPQPGESVLDMCAAPGGKTTYLAQKMANRGRIIAADSSNARLGLVAENCRRLGVQIVATLACDGTRLTGCLRGTRFDRVLLDAPCSNTGVLRRRVDLRWRLDPAEITRLAELQSRLLGAAAQLTRPGGILVYSTCSLEPAENEQVLDRFRKAHPQFVLETTGATFPPHDSVDGAFVARLRQSAI